MKEILFSVVSLVLCVASPGQTLQSRPPEPAPLSPARALANNDPFYVKLRNIHLGAEAIPVKDFILKRDAGTFVFKTGVFRLLEPVNDKITGAVFIGEGSFSLTPPIEVERRYISILTKGQPFVEEFGSAVFRFSDGTETEIRKAAAGGSAPDSGNASGLLSEVQQQLRKKLKDNLDARLLADVLSSHAGGKFLAFIQGRKYSNKMIYQIEPEGAGDFIRPEEIALTTWDDSHAGVWAAFHFSNEYAAGTATSSQQNYPIAVDHQKLDTSIAKSGFLSGLAETKLTAIQDGVRVLSFELFPTLRVESVTGDAGRQLSFIQEDKDQDADFAVILPKELKKGESYTITTKYAGKDAVSNEGGGNYYPIARSSWYPGLGFGRYATYDMTFRVPKGMRMVATGKLLRSIDEGDQTITEWTSEVPQAVAGFNFGKFKREEGKPIKQSYLLETFVNPEPPDMIRNIQHSGDEIEAAGKEHVMGLSTLGNMSTVSLMKKAMGEAQLAIELYTEYFGEAPYKRLAMTQQTAFSYGQSWPGLVYLPITYFFDSTVRHQLGMEDAHGYFKVVGPHEIAHQWWAHMVGFNSYRDQWMSEGFADMSASLFLQAFYTEHGLDDYHKFWADERLLLTQKNKEGKRPIDVGPLTLGYRLSNAKSGFSIPRALIYPKGAYVLQMLRFMLRDERSKDPDVQFKALMHEFTRTYANRPASTEEFKAMVEKYMTPEMDIDGNHKMNWFFDEYIYGTDYPSYKFEHSFSTDANGDVVMNFKLAQSNVRDRFAMLVPIYLEFGNGRVMRLGSARLIGNNSVEQHIPLKGMKEKPRRAVAAYYDDVLGSMENK
jgi:Peptidase family M1 domain